jgi:hypothetical protein
MHAARRRPALTAALAGIGLAVSACSGGLIDEARGGLSCLDDSNECVEQRQAVLKSMLADKDRSWLKEPADANAHASGVRLFAFRSQKGDMSCEELTYARKEAESAPKVMKASQGLSPAQISRASLFAVEVKKELATEMRKKRCRA